MLISQAYATETMAVPPVAAAPTPLEAFGWNMGLVAVLVALFYVLLIRPQQKRFKAHAQMLAGLKKGDKVITGGGLIGTIDKIVDDHDAVVDLGNGMKVTALRATLQARDGGVKPANDVKKA